MATPLPFPLRDRIAAALTTACPKHSHCDLVGPAVWAVVGPEMEQRDAECAAAERTYAELEAHYLAEVEKLREELVSVEGQRADYRKTLKRVSEEAAELRAHLAARDNALRLVGEHADTVKGERDQLKKLLEEALHLHMHGERAPGGQENWRDWEIKTERTLRAMLDKQTALWEAP